MSRIAADLDGKRCLMILCAVHVNGWRLIIDSHYRWVVDFILIFNLSTSVAKKNSAKTAAATATSSANLGFESKPWLAADKLRGAKEVEAAIRANIKSLGYGL